VDRLAGEVRGVGAHVGDQADLAFLAERHALVELLREPHGAAGGEAELARGFLLQGRGDEGRRRAALALLARDLQHLERADDPRIGARALRARRVLQRLARRSAPRRR
jgi:hypothetical protein